MPNHSDHCHCSCDRLEGVLIIRMNQAESSRQAMETRGFPDTAEFWEDVRNILKACLEDAGMANRYQMSEDCSECKRLNMVCFDCYISQGGFND